MKISGVRVLLLFLLVAAIVSCYSLQLMRYQITDGESYRQTADRSTYQTVKIDARRGDILDRYGRVLATTTVGYSIVMIKTGFPKENADKNQEILALTDIFNKNNIKWVDTLPVSSGAAWQFGADNDVKKLRKFLNDTDKTAPTKGGKRAKLLAEDANGTVDQLMARLKSRYGVADSYSKEQQRVIIGVRYSMDQAGFSYSGTFTLATDLNSDTITQISERSLPGIDITEQSTRSYPDGTIAPQVIGAVGGMTADEYKKTYKGKLDYTIEDTIGKAGVEKTMEQYLHGVSGTESVQINKQGVISEKSPLDDPKPGDSVVLTIDSDLQKVVQAELPVIIQQIKEASKQGPLDGSTCSAAAAVVLNIKTGEVLAMANYPTYNLNDYSANFAALNADPNKPLLNRCVSGTYRPGSTFKPCTSVAGLTSGAITKNTIIQTHEYYTRYANLGPGKSYSGYDENGDQTYNVIEALAASSNYFFNEVAYRIGQLPGGDNILENTAKNLGLGVKTGIELPGEATGAISGPTYAKAHDLTWYPAHQVQSGIGQMYNSYTLIQLANYIGAIVNGGTRYQVHIVKSVQSYDNSKTILENQPKVVSGDYKIPDDVVKTIKEGMRQVTEAEDGTATSVFVDFNKEYQMGLGGKTGTAQVIVNNIMYYNGVFVSFAPFDNPQIAVAVVAEHGHNGFQTAPVARDVFNYYYLRDQVFTAAGFPDNSSALPVQADTLIK